MAEKGGETKYGAGSRQRPQRYGRMQAANPAIRRCRSYLPLGPGRKARCSLFLSNSFGRHRRAVERSGPTDCRPGDIDDISTGRTAWGDPTGATTPNSGKDKGSTSFRRC